MCVNVSIRSRSLVTVMPLVCISMFCKGNWNVSPVGSHASLARIRMFVRFITIISLEAGEKAQGNEIAVPPHRQKLAANFLCSTFKS